MTYITKLYYSMCHCNHEWNTKTVGVFLFYVQVITIINGMKSWTWVSRWLVPSLMSNNWRWILHMTLWSLPATVFGQYHFHTFVSCSWSKWPLADYSTKECGVFCVCRNSLSSQEVVDFIRERLDNATANKTLSSICEEVGRKSV